MPHQSGAPFASVRSFPKEQWYRAGVFFSPLPLPLSFFRLRTYPWGYYFYSPQSSTVIKSKMAATTIRTQTTVSPTQNTPALQAKLIALYVRPKNSNYLRSHLRAIMALDHSRLGLENKSDRIFCVRQVYFTKSCQQVWGSVNQPFILFIHQIWGETIPWGAVFIVQTSDRM